jgi:hypothetical protein
MVNAKSFLMGVGVMLLLVLVHRLLNPPETVPVIPESEIIVQVPDLPPEPVARTQAQAMNNRMSTLGELREAYDLTAEQEREIRRIIESAEYAP